MLQSCQMVAQHYNHIETTSQRCSNVTCFPGNICALKSNKSPLKASYFSKTMEVYLGPFQTSMMKFFGKIDALCFCKKKSAIDVS